MTAVSAITKNVKDEIVANFKFGFNTSKSTRTNGSDLKTNKESFLFACVIYNTENL